MWGASYALPLLALSMCRPLRPAARRGQGKRPLIVRGPALWLGGGRDSDRQPPTNAVVRFATTTATARCLPVAPLPERLFYSRQEIGALKAADRADRRATGRRTLQPRCSWLQEQQHTAARN